MAITGFFGIKILLVESSWPQNLRVPKVMSQRSKELCARFTYFFFGTAKPWEVESSFVSNFAKQTVQSNLDCTLNFCPFLFWKEGRKCTIAKELLRSFCSNLYSVDPIQTLMICHNLAPNGEQKVAGCGHLTNFVCLYNT